jgi:homocitrate synthase NifV
MGPKFIFIDKTLSCAIESQTIASNELPLLKQKISAMSPILFDIPLELLAGIQGNPGIDFQDVRAVIGPDINQLKLAHKLGCNHIRVCFEPAALRNSPLPFMETLAEAGWRGMKITLGGLNIAPYFLDIADMLRKLVKENTITALVLEDSASRLDPLATYRALRRLKRVVPWDMEYHGYNGLGMATGNALGAVKSDIYNIAVSIGGIGGYPAFEEVIMSTRHLLHLPVSVPPDLAITCQEILEGMGQHIPAAKPIIGSRIFAHESGIHVDGVIKKSELYEPFAPETVGLTRMIIIGKHSGKAAIEQKLTELEINIHPSLIPRVLEKVREQSIRQKAPVSDSQLPQLVRELYHES